MKNGTTSHLRRQNKKDRSKGKETQGKKSLRSRLKIREYATSSKTKRIVMPLQVKRTILTCLQMRTQSKKLSTFPTSMIGSMSASTIMMLQSWLCPSLRRLSNRQASRISKRLPISLSLSILMSQRALKLLM